MDALRKRRPGVRFLLTTGTVTSAALARERLNHQDLHQYAPLDAPVYIKRFLDHWKPDLVALTESEIWPNTIMTCHLRGIPMALVNARISERSFKRWRKNRTSSRPLFSRIRLILAQNERLARRLRELGGRDVVIAGNLKVDAPPLPVDQAGLAALKSEVGTRPVFLAASTHPGEDEIVFETLARLKAAIPDLLLVLAPRHPARGGPICDMAKAAGFSSARRSLSQRITSETDVYVADTVGEMGIFYSLAQIAFIGGTLVDRGGQNPIEPGRFNVAVLAGPSRFNFADAYEELSRRGAVIDVCDAKQLAQEVAILLAEPTVRAQLIMKAAAGLEAMVGALDVTADALAALLADTEHALRPADEGLKRAS